MMSDSTQVQNDHQPKPLQNGFDPDFSYSEVDQSGPPPISAQMAALSCGPISPAHFCGIASMLLMTRARVVQNTTGPFVGSLVSPRSQRR
jgi:hypothetical protein